MAHLKQADLPEIPAGSSITIEETVDGLRLHWLNPRGGSFRYAVILVFLFWLVVWSVAAVCAVAEVMRDVQRASTPDPFRLFWLGIWLVSGGFIVYLVLKLMAPGKPEVLLLGDCEFHHRTGTPPLVLRESRSWDFSHSWREFRRLKDTRTDKVKVGRPLLERVGEHQRLTVDVGADRIEIGEFLREPEREWLAQVLQLWFAER